MPPPGTMDFREITIASLAAIRLSKKKVKTTSPLLPKQARSLDGEGFSFAPDNAKR